MKGRVLITTSVKNAIPECIVEGSIQEPCWLCNEPVWISPSSQAMDRSLIFSVCEECLPKIQAKGNELGELSGEQVAEIRKHCGPSIECPTCHMVSSNIGDIVNRYCGNCKKFWGKK